MQNPYVIAVLCGLAAALCNLAPLSGTPGGFMLNMVAPFPVFFAGLLHGWLLSVVAGVVAAVATAAFGGPTVAAVFVGLAVAPAALLVRQALLAQPGPEGDLIWYPLDRLAIWLFGIGGAIGFGAITLVGGDTIGGVVDQAMAMINDQDQIPADVQAQLKQAMIGAVPAFVAASAVLSLILNGAFAQRFAERTGRAVRPAMGFSDFSMPQLGGLAFGGLLLLSALLSGLPGQLALIGTMVLGLLFTCAGLAVAHTFARRQGGTPALAGLYISGLAMLFLLGPVLPFILMLMGIADAFFGLRPKPSGNAGT